MASGSDAIGNAVKNQFAVVDDKLSVVSLVKGIKAIVGGTIKRK
ncbi:Variable outer membrane protein [Borrelia duttonii CR2A]|uniref:Variable outer membrane protein n=1 Tax=Borrelia duttonii CR2A TaxID=1432657 RepID=W6TEZ9_9SPIR|nr:Variable outer membrane protein [Borrelia duttonii CR2A]